MFTALLCTLTLATPLPDPASAPAAQDEVELEALLDEERAELEAAEAERLRGVASRLVASLA